jgi:hypothetical protein
MRSELTPAPRWSLPIAGIAGTVWLAAAAWVFSGAAPHLGHAGGAQSDLAIPQLMANAERLTPYHLYYWGQDRFSGAPFIFAWLVRRLTGAGWTGDGLFWLMMGAVATAAWPLARLGGRALPPVLLLVLALSPTSREYILNIGQPYAWQVALILWSWWSLRRLAQRTDEAKSPLGGSRGTRWTHLAPAAFFCFLATWMSTLSVALLGIIAVVESGSRQRMDRRSRGSRLRPLLIPVGLGLVAEQAVKLVHAVYSRNAGLRFQATMFDLDVKHLAQNIRMQTAALMLDPWWMTVPFAGLLSLTLLRRLNGADDRARTAVTMTAMALANFLLTTLVSWTRLNDYDPRYVAITYVFAALGAAGGLLALASRTGFDLPVGAVVTAASLALVLWLAPRAGPSETKERLQRVTAELVHRAPGGVLLGSYWGTYLFVDGTAARPLVPIVEEGDFNRTPWTASLLKESNEVIVSHYRDSQFGSADAPVPYIQERGALLELVTPRWLVDGPMAFSLYRNRTREEEPGLRAQALQQVLAADRRSRLSLPLTAAKEGDEALRLDFPARREGTAVLFFGPSHGAPKTLPNFRIVLSPAGEAHFDVTVTPPLISIRFSAKEPLQTLRLVYAETRSTEPLSLRSAEVLP